jgi:hypothetical protein
MAGREDGGMMPDIGNRLEGSTLIVRIPLRSSAVADATASSQRR